MFIKRVCKLEKRKRPRMGKKKREKISGMGLWRQGEVVTYFWRKPGRGKMMTFKLSKETFVKGNT